MELVGSGDEVFAGQLCHLLGNQSVESLGSIQTGTDCGAAQCQFKQRLNGELQKLHVTLQAGAPAADFLAELNGGSILQMGASALNDALVLLLQTEEGSDQHLGCGDQLVFQRDHGRDVHSGGEGVVGGLAHVDVIIGMQQLLACDLIAAVGDDFVCVHIGLGTGAGLPNNQREVIVERTGDNLIASGRNGGELFLGHLLGLQSVVSQSGRFFKNAERASDLAGHDLNTNTDLKILVAALCLRRPVPIGRDLHFSHGVVFNAVIHYVSP